MCCTIPFIQQSWNDVIIEMENKFRRWGDGVGVAPEEILIVKNCSASWLYQNQYPAYEIVL